MPVWTYEQSSGKLYRDRECVAQGYSGHGEGKNNPAAEGVRNTGPIPAGKWKVGPAYQHPRKGGCVLPLTAALGTSTHGRSGFLIHGDSLVNPGTASEGCIVLPYQARERLSREKVTELHVVHTLLEVPV